MKPILIIAAVRQETFLLEQVLCGSSRKKRVPFGHVPGCVGKLPLAICTAGVGRINAAGATAALIERLQPQLVINVGCAGAFPSSGLEIGDLAVASSEAVDDGVITSAGWLGLREMNLPSLVYRNRRYYNEVPLAKHPAEKAMRLAARYGVRMLRGRFLTVSTCSGSAEQARAVTGRFKAICENMEGAAVAQTCLRYGIDCLEIRGISNMVEERNLAAWDIPRAVEAAQRFVLKFLEEMDRPELSEGSC